MTRHTDPHMTRFISKRSRSAGDLKRFFDQPHDDADYAPHNSTKKSDVIYLRHAPFKHLVDAFAELDWQSQQHRDPSPPDSRVTDARSKPSHLAHVTSSGRSGDVVGGRALYAYGRGSSDDYSRAEAHIADVIKQAHREAASQSVSSSASHVIKLSQSAAVAAGSGHVDHSTRPFSYLAPPPSVTSAKKPSHVTADRSLPVKTRPQSESSNKTQLSLSKLVPSPPPRRHHQTDASSESQCKGGRRGQCKIRSHVTWKRRSRPHPGHVMAALRLYEQQQQQVMDSGDSDDTDLFPWARPADKIYEKRVQQRIRRHKRACRQLPWQHTPPDRPATPQAEDVKTRNYVTETGQARMRVKSYRVELHVDISGARSRSADSVTRSPTTSSQLH
jgi:hypothetical protein